MITASLDIGSVFFDAVLLCLLFGLAFLISKIKIFAKYLLPSCLIAGVLGLVLTSTSWNPDIFEKTRFEFYVYHSLAILFVVMALKRPNKKSRAAINIGAIMVMTYLIQALVGLLVLFFFIKWIDPSVIPALGLLLPLSFGMGPGTAFTIGQSWSAYGVQDGGQIGLALASMGFVIAYIVGVGLINKRQKAKAEALPRRSGSGSRRTLPSLPDSGQMVESVFLTAVLFVIYGIALLLIHGIGLVMDQINLTQEKSILWSFHFLIAFFVSTLIRPLVMKMENLSWANFSDKIDYSIAFWASLMIASSIIAIDLSAIRPHATLLFSLVIPGALATWWIVRGAINRSFEDYPFKRYVGLFGEMTGTLSSGLALVMVTDPSFETPVARDMALGSAYALAFGFPLLALINAPLALFNGELIGYLGVFGVCMGYFLLVFIVWRKFNTR